MPSIHRPALIIVCALLALLIGGGVMYSYGALFSEIDLAESNPQDMKIDIPAGSSLSRVAQDLYDSGYIASPALLKLWARLQGVDGQIQTGEFELELGMSPVDLLMKIVHGEPIQYRITLVEGWTFAQALEALWQSDEISANLQEFTTAEIAARMGLSQQNPEGLLYPDTYFYTRGTSDLELLTRANERLELVLREEWDSRVGALPYASPYEALTLASIIEKESASNSERTRIAAVFITRLERSMRLQSDPTVIYGMGDRYAGDIRRQDLLEETPYNTYRIDGLPPTPIALSGRESIFAALNPEATDYLYFVAKGDGSHQFSRTLEEHNAAVRRYQLEQND